MNDSLWKLVWFDVEEWINKPKTNVVIDDSLSETHQMRWLIIKVFGMDSMRHIHHIVCKSSISVSIVKNLKTQSKNSTNAKQQHETKTIQSFFSFSCDCNKWIATMSHGTMQFNSSIYACTYAAYRAIYTLCVLRVFVHMQTRNWIAPRLNNTYLNFFKLDLLVPPPITIIIARLLQK